MRFTFTKQNFFKTIGDHVSHYAAHAVVWAICSDYLSWKSHEVSERELERFFFPYIDNNRIIVPIEKQEKFLEDLNALIVMLKLME